MEHGVVDAVYELFTIRTCLAVFLVTILLVRWICSKDATTIPPGPAGYPLIGNVLLLRNELPSRLYNRLHKQYGDIFSLRMGSKLFVIVNGYDTLKEVFVKFGDNFSDRPDMYMFTEVFKKKGMMSSSGDFWKRTRSFVTTSLKRFGFGKRSLEENIRDEVEEYLNVIEEEHGKSFEFNPIIQTSIANVICRITVGERFGHKDARLQKILECVKVNGSIGVTVGVVSIFHLLKYLPGDMLHIQIYENNIRSILHFLREYIDFHKKTVRMEETRDFIDAFLQERARHTEEEDIFTDENLLYCLSDLFLGGTETTATVLNWAVVFLIRHPPVQTRMREEIDHVVGHNRLPSLNDRPNLPYSEAVIAETLRRGNILPYSLPHTATETMVVKGYTIPKGACVVANTGSVMNDPDEFRDPECFNPDRFIDKDGNFTGHEKVAAVFSLGKRVCMAEALARMELFLFMTSLVQRFQLLPESVDCPPSVEAKEGIINSPKPFKFRAVKL